MVVDNTPRTISPSTLIQFNATVIVGIFLFINVSQPSAPLESSNLSLLEFSLPSLLILSTIIPFALSASFALIYGEYGLGYPSALYHLFKVGIAGLSTALAVGGMFYLLIVLTYSVIFNLYAYF